MKNIFLVLFLFIFFSCDKKENKEIVPVDNIENKNAVVPIKVEDTLEDKIIFTVQIAALKNGNETLANLEGIQLFNENSLTKYRLGNFETYKEAKNHQRKLIRNYKGAFVQALKNNAPISITEALQ